MTKKIIVGRLCEYLVKVILESKTGYAVENLNDEKINNPTTDLRVTNQSNGEKFEVSVKAKDGPTWPAVRGISSKNQYIVFVDLQTKTDPDFYVLNNRQWIAVLKKLLPNRDAGAEIVNGAIEWNWMKDGNPKKRRGSYLKVDDIASYKDAWKVIPGVEAHA